MTTHTTGTRRPATVWITVVLLLMLAFLSAVGGYVFNLSGADDAGDWAVGGVFLLLAALYLGCAARLPSGARAWRTLAIGLAVAHGLFNAVVKVGMEGETVSLMFVGLTAAVVALLGSSRTRAFFAPGPLAA